jgi:hypothetical protein
MHSNLAAKSQPVWDSIFSIVWHEPGEPTRRINNLTAQLSQVPRHNAAFSHLFNALRQRKEA